MKLMKKTGIYKASNVTFDPKTISAYSYDWFKFVTIMNGLVVFNNYNYSITTVKHQYKVRRLMQELGINVDLFVETNLSLDDNRAVDSIIETIDYKIKVLNEEIAKPKSKMKKNKERLLAIKDLCAQRNKVIHHLKRDSFSKLVMEL